MVLASRHPGGLPTHLHGLAGPRRRQWCPHHPGKTGGREDRGWGGCPFSRAQSQPKPTFGESTQFSGFPGGSDGKESTCNAGDPGLIPGLGRSPGEGNGNPLQYSCLENPMEEEPGGLQSMGSQRIGHNWESQTHMHTHTHTHTHTQFSLILQEVSAGDQKGNKRATIHDFLPLRHGDTDSKELLVEEIHSVRTRRFQSRSGRDFPGGQW